MALKHLERLVTYDAAVEEAEDKTSFRIEYYLVEHENQCKEKVKDPERIYGIEICKKSLQMGTEREAVLDISPSKEDTRGLLHMLAENAVTPITLKCILDDLLGV